MEKTVALPTAERVPALGLGTWRMGESASTRDAEIAAVRHAIECGYRLFDTAEMYGEGGAETVLGRAIAESLRAGAIAREDLFIVSKVYPHHADREGVAAACDRSRKRLGLDVIDLYLLHWRGAVPLAETVDAFEGLKAAGSIREWGVSNFDIDDLIELESIDRPTLMARPGKLHCATNQIYYALDERGPEFSLLTYQQTLHMPTMAYCPLGRGSLASDATLRSLAAARGATAAQVALAWAIRAGDVIAIPKAVGHSHLDENLAALDLELTADELKAIDAVFVPPLQKTPLAMVVSGPPARACDSRCDRRADRTRGTRPARRFDDRRRIGGNPHRRRASVHATLAHPRIAPSCRAAVRDAWPTSPFASITVPITATSLSPDRP